jgi:hypothetical protein
MNSRTATLEMDEVQSRVFGALPAAFYTTSLERRFAGRRFLSGAMSAIVGYDAQAFVSNEELWPSRIHSDDLPRVLGQISSIASTGVQTMEYRWRCADDSEKLFIDQAILGSDGTEPNIVGICLDISSRLSLIEPAPSASVGQAQAASGSLSEIKHELNNMASVILWNIEPLTRSLKDSGKTLDRLHNALQAAARCVELIHLLPKSG